MIQDEKLRPKGVFLVGVPGTGKSFSAKYCASLLGWSLVEFNISTILEKENPISTLHLVFSYLQDLSQKGEKFVLWIDEIEKAFIGEKSAERRLFGQLLTILNDLNTDTGYRINGIFWITANNVGDIVKTNPELFRRGRFDELFFVDNPLKEDAKKMVEYYAKYYGVEYKGDLAEDVVITAEVIYKTEMTKGSTDASRFIYVPSEIKEIVKSLKIRHLLKQDWFRRNKDREIAEILFPYAVRKKLSVVSSGYRESLDHFINLEVSPDLSSLDVACVLAQIEPISISMASSLSVIRSNEHLFLKAD